MLGCWQPDQIRSASSSSISSCYFQVLLLCAIPLTFPFTILKYYPPVLTLRSPSEYNEVSFLTLIVRIVSMCFVLLSLLLCRAPDNRRFGIRSMGSISIIPAVVVFSRCFMAGFRTGPV